METMSTLERVFEAERDLKQARFGLEQVLALPNATEAMRDWAYQTVATLVDKIAALNAQWDAEVAAWQAEMAGEETPADAVTLADVTFVALPVVVDVPSDITFRDTRPVKGETDRDRVTRLAARAVIEGIRIYANPASPFCYATSSDGRHLYQIAPEAMKCSCRAEGVCKHIALYAVASGVAHRLAPEVLTATREDAKRAARPGITGVNACYSCRISRATIVIATDGEPFVCPACAWDLMQRPHVAGWSIDAKQLVIHQINEAVRMIGSMRAAS